MSDVGVSDGRYMERQVLMTTPGVEVDDDGALSYTTETPRDKRCRAVISPDRLWQSSAQDFIDEPARCVLDVGHVEEVLSGEYAVVHYSNQVDAKHLWIKWLDEACLPPDQADAWIEEQDHPDIRPAPRVQGTMKTRPTRSITA